MERKERFLGDGSCQREGVFLVYVFLFWGARNLPALCSDSFYGEPVFLLCIGLSILWVFALASGCAPSEHPQAHPDEGGGYGVVRIG